MLSFVVPCYNVEKYIQSCLDSIFACDLPEDLYEVICINDCSLDHVQEILERNRDSHNNLKIVVHGKNKGWGGARNSGILQANGRYLWFVDADDTILGKGLNALVQKAVGGNVDVFCFNYRKVDDNGNVLSTHILFNDRAPENGYSFVQNVFKQGEFIYHIGYVWRFLFKTEYLRSHQLFFPEHVCWEDTVYMPKAILEADRVASSSEVMYSYRTNADSISNTFSRVYPAKLIFEYSFCAGSDLLHFSEEIKDDGLKESLYRMAINKYINGFPIPLFRTDKIERKKFYEIINKSASRIKPLRCKMFISRKLLLSPVIGSVLADFGAILYKAINKNRSKYVDSD